jgi:hypothetical protein
MYVPHRISAANRMKAVGFLGVSDTEVLKSSLSSWSSATAVRAGAPTIPVRPWALIVEKWCDSSKGAN